MDKKVKEKITDFIEQYIMQNHPLYSLIQYHINILYTLNKNFKDELDKITKRSLDENVNMKRIP